MSEKPVYCIQCRWLHAWGGSRPPAIYDCVHPQNLRRSIGKKWLGDVWSWPSKSPQKLNRHNNCPWYEAK